MRRSLLVLALLLLALPAAAQEVPCELRVDLSVDGSAPNPSEYMTPFDFYVLLNVESLADAVSYKLEINSLGDNVLPVGSPVYGPRGTGLNIETVNGSNVGLGECAVGFGNTIVVEKRTLMLVYDLFLSGYLSPNPDEYADSGAVSDCNGTILRCPTQGWFFWDVIPVESHSFGQVKALYGGR